VSPRPVPALDTVMVAVQVNEAPGAKLLSGKLLSLHSAAVYVTAGRPDGVSVGAPTLERVVSPVLVTVVVTVT